MCCFWAAFEAHSYGVCVLHSVSWVVLVDFCDVDTDLLLSCDVFDCYVQSSDVQFGIFINGELSTIFFPLVMLLVSPYINLTE